MFFGLGFWNRKVSYEVFLQSEGRWQLDCVCDEEEVAIAEAKRILATGRSTLTKVVRLRTLVNGASSETVVYEQEVKVASVKPISISTPSGEVVVCRGVDDILGPAGRRTVGQVMRDYLQRTGITATELLHNYSHQRKLQDKGGLIIAAVHKVAGLQAAATGETAKARVGVLDKLVDEVERKARMFAGERGGYPPFRGSDLAGYSAAVRAKAGDEAHDYALRSLLSVWLFEFRSLPAKVEVLANLAMETPDPALSPLLDGMLADGLIFAEVVQELFGAQPSLGHCLVAMAGILVGHDEAVANAPSPALKQIAGLIRSGIAPESRDAMAERLLRELASDRPLDSRNPENDPTLLEALVPLLTAENMPLDRERVEKLLAERRTRQRQAVLRAHGLHSVADNLRP
ncbi:hypothetical protein HHL28_05445 [Aerophototrophica crusticola]|uniref:Uncharacterized protein n=1 Tax=Aerophototrophica crusticola TaxID=1709002 RepID=A0A858R5G9_9PROT|nr:hypothetical protein HHL28_05445 [Rhodospirillaceae bacterium B3]